MKYIKWKSLCITGLVCLSPILLGIALWDTLPDTIAIHFNMYNEPDNFASKEFAVFGLPLMMLVPQIISCMINDFNTHKHGERKKFTLVTKWIIPIMSVILQVVTLGYSLGWNLDIRKVTALMVSIIFLVIGNYLPKFDYIKNHDTSTDKARKINRFIGYETVIMGVLLLASMFFSATVSVVCLLMFIPYAVIAVIYGIVVGKNG